MRKVFSAALLTILILLLALLHAMPVSAHVAEPRLEISLERINPGGTMDIRGVGFVYEETTTLYLIRPGIMVHMGDVIADTEGIFFQTVTLPADLPAGEYNFRAVTEHHEVLSPLFTVQGPAMFSEGGGQGERDEDDGLLAPMPTFAPGVVPGEVPQPRPENTAPDVSVKADTSPKWNTTLLISSIFFSIGIIFWLSRRFVRKS